MFNKKTLLHRCLTVSLVLSGLLASTMIASQSNVSACHYHRAHHIRTQRVAKRSKRTRRNKKRTKRGTIQHRRSKAVHVRRTKRNHKIRKALKRMPNKRTYKNRKSSIPTKIEHRETSKDPVHVTPDDKD